MKEKKILDVCCGSKMFWFQIFREKAMSDEEIEEKQIEFCKSMRENYEKAGKTLEILEYSITEVN